MSAGVNSKVSQADLREPTQTQRRTFALGNGLDRRLDRERDRADANAPDDLDRRQVSSRRARASVTNHQAERQDLDAEAEDDDRLEDADVPSDDAHSGCRQGTREAGERSDSLGGEGRLIGGDKDVGVAAIGRSGLARSLIPCRD